MTMSEWERERLRENLDIERYEQNEWIVMEMHKGKKKRIEPEKNRKRKD